MAPLGLKAVMTEIPQAGNVERVSDGLTIPHNLPGNDTN